MVAAVKIDFVSDVSCPWCVIGWKALEQALDRVRGDIAADVHFQPFELNPNMPAGGQDLTEHLVQKYGSSPQQLAQNHASIRERGAELGFTFDMGKRHRIYNTFDAHRLLHWAELEGRQTPLKQGLFAAYFTDGADPSDHVVLLDIVTRAGLDATRARQILDSDEYASDVRARQEFYGKQGIQAVPSVIIDDKWLIQGGQPVAAFEQALRQIAAEKQQSSAT